MALLTNFGHHRTRRSGLQYAGAKRRVIIGADHRVVDPVNRQTSGVQFVTVEDTTGRFHASHGQAEPAGEHLGC